MTSRESKLTKIFLSASVPLPTRDKIYFETADVVAIRDAIRALTMVIVEQGAQLIFGGHPAITPMIRLQIAATGKPVGERFIVFQSRYFERSFPADNAAFEHVEVINAVDNDREASLLAMRRAMLTGRFDAGIFIGGMEGVEQEFVLFKEFHAGIPALPIASTGAAAKRLFEADPQLRRNCPQLRDEISYLTLMRDLINNSRRNPA